MDAMQFVIILISHQYKAISIYGSDNVYILEYSFSNDFKLLSIYMIFNCFMRIFFPYRDATLLTIPCINFLTHVPDYYNLLLLM